MSSPFVLQALLNIIVYLLTWVLICNNVYMQVHIIDVKSTLWIYSIKLNSAGIRSLHLLLYILCTKLCPDFCYVMTKLYFILELFYSNQKRKIKKESKPVLYLRSGCKSVHLEHICIFEKHFFVFFPTGFKYLHIWLFLLSFLYVCIE